MAEPAMIMTGKVFKIVAFGAFVRLSDGSSGLVHISEISDGYVQDVQDFLEVGTEVKVLVLATEADGRRKLSIKKVSAQPRLKKAAPQPSEDELTASREEKKRQKKQLAIDKSRENTKSLFATPPEDPDDAGFGSGRSFEDKLAKFMKESEERQVDVKRQTDHKRGGGYVRKS